MLKNLVNRAYTFAQEAHEGQERKWVELPYFIHPKFVARILEDFTKDPVLVASGLLHDVVEDTDITSEMIHKEFGSKVGNLVDELTSIIPKGITKLEYLYDKMMRMSDDALTIKLVDRLHNVQFLEMNGIPLKFITKYVIDTEALISSVYQNRIGHNPDHIHKLFAYRIASHVNWLAERYRIDVDYMDIRMTK
jgi:(p)ppGpp synthase/HD superfamily hydrolase